MYYALRGAINPSSVFIMPSKMQNYFFFSSFISKILERKYLSTFGDLIITTFIGITSRICFGFCRYFILCKFGKSGYFVPAKHLQASLTQSDNTNYL